MWQKLGGSDVHFTWNDYPKPSPPSCLKVAFVSALHSTLWCTAPLPAVNKPRQESFGVVLDERAFQKGKMMMMMMMTHKRQALTEAEICG